MNYLKSFLVGMAASVLTEFIYVVISFAVSVRASVGGTGFDIRNQVTAGPPYGLTLFIQTN